MESFHFDSSEFSELSEFLSMQCICSPNVPFSTNDFTSTFLLDLMLISAFFSSFFFHPDIGKSNQQRIDFNDLLL